MWVFLVAVVATALRLYGIDFGLNFDDPFLAIFHNHTDEESMVVTVRDHFLRGNPHPDIFLYWGGLGFWLFGLVDSLVCWTWSLGTSGGYGAVLDSLDRNPSVLFLIHRIIVCAAGIATTLLTMRIARREIGDRAAILAGFIMATCYFHVRECHYGTLDVVLGLMVTLSIDRCLLWIRTGATNHALWAGFFAGLAGATKYNALMLGVTILIAAFFATQARRERGDTRSSAWRSVAFPLIAMVAGYHLVSPHIFYAGNDTLDHILQLSRNTFRLDDLMDVLVFHGTMTFFIGFGEIAIALSMIGVLTLASRGSPERRLLVLTSSILLLPLSIHLGAVRYGISLAPFLSLFAASGILILSRLFGRFQKHGLVVLLISACLPSVFRSVAFDHLIGKTDTRILALDALRENGAGRSEVTAFGYLGVPSQSTFHRPPVMVHYLQVVYSIGSMTPSDFRRNPPHFIIHEHSAAGVDYLGWDDFAPFVLDHYDRLLSIEPRIVRGKPVLPDQMTGTPQHFIPFAKPWQMKQPGPALTVYKLRDSD